MTTATMTDAVCPSVGHGDGTALRVQGKCRSVKNVIVVLSKVAFATAQTVFYWVFWRGLVVNLQNWQRMSANPTNAIKGFHMNRVAFCKEPDVIVFVTWLAHILPELQIGLCIKKSKFVPGGLNAEVCGIQNIIPNHYVWKATGMETGNWEETTTHLNCLATALQSAVKAPEGDGSLNACGKIIKWGGDRNAKKGATPFLGSLGSNLSTYISDVGAALNLANADLTAFRPRVCRMNSMLTKIHALNSTDGLPIYDSRVAAAIATLVEMWRQKSDNRTSIPDLLKFPATLRSRSVTYAFPCAPTPGVLNYSTTAVVRTASEWCSAKVRLGWLMECVLTNSPKLWACEQHPQRMRNFEAALFMIGYDVKCLRSPT